MNNTLVKSSLINILPSLKTKKDIIDYALDTKLIQPTVYKKLIAQKSNHSVKHLSFMINQINRGETFYKAHKLAIIRVGK